jgi:hypothetical protein
MTQLPPLFLDRPFWLQVAGGIVVPVVFGILTGFALGWNEIVYYAMAGPLAIAGGFLGGIEHDRVDEGVLRGAMGGLVYGSFILIGHEITNAAPEAHLPDPQVGLVVVTTLVGAILGGIGAWWRARRPEASSHPRAARQS